HKPEAPARGHQPEAPARGTPARSARTVLSLALRACGATPFAASADRSPNTRAGECARQANISERVGLHGPIRSERGEEVDLRTDSLLEGWPNPPAQNSEQSQVF